MLNVQISFDDGNESDIRAARLLKHYGFVGTFYIPSNEVAKTKLLDLKDIHEIIVNECGQEIGGHTVNHPMDMKLLDEKQLQFEIGNNKKLCEMLLAKKPITKFCYPRGRHNELVREWVYKMGYKEARTTRVLQIENDTKDPFQTPTTIHMYPRDEYEGKDWFDLAREYFDKALEASKSSDEVFFSLWGHTTELNRIEFGWEKFEEMLKIMKEKLSTGANATA